MKLLIDIGNTSSKLAVADGERFVHDERLAEPWAEALQRLHKAYDIEDIVISCVGKDGVALRAALDASPEAYAPQVWLTWDTPCCISGVPEGYGADRLAADIGAYDGQHALLVIDAGTCITYDLIIDGRLTGGVISPGVQLRLNAMNDYTAALPRFDARNAPAVLPLMASDTEGCMLSAALHGVRFELEGYIRALQTEYPDLSVVITGGNRFDLSSNIIYRYDPLLVLRGLVKVRGKR